MLQASIRQKCQFLTLQRLDLSLKHMLGKWVCFQILLSSWRRIARLWRDLLAPERGLKTDGYRNCRTEFDFIPVARRR